MHARRWCLRLQSSPEQGSRTDEERMQQHTHPTRLRGGLPMPLTLFAQGTGATTADAGRIDHAQAPIGFAAPLVGDQRLASRTAQRAIGLEGKVLPGEAARFPGQGHCLLAHTPCTGAGGVGRLLCAGGEQEQTRSCASGRLQADGPVPGAGSTPIARRSASLLAQQAHEYTSDRGPAPGLHRQERFQRRRDAGTGPRHRQAVNASCGSWVKKSS